LPDTDQWTKFAAVATMAASVIALAVATVPPLWRRYWRRPKLEVRIGAVEPWARVTRSPSGDLQSWLRIQVENKGRAEATNVRAVVHAWYERALPATQWVKRDLDPSALHWVSMARAWQALADGGFTQMRETAPVVSLPTDLSDFADLIEYTHQNNEHTLSLDDQRPRGFGVHPRNTTGEFILTISVVAENAKTLTKHIHYMLTRESQFSEVRFDEPPSDYRSQGILTMTDLMREQRNSEGTDV
jgi:hypothetical protein